MTLGNRIAHLRKEKHLSQEKLAEELLVSRQAISKWELDQSTPDLENIKRLSTIFSVSVDELIHGSIESNQSPKANPIWINVKKYWHYIGIPLIIWGVLDFIRMMGVGVFLFNVRQLGSKLSTQHANSMDSHSINDFFSQFPELNQTHFNHLTNFSSAGEAELIFDIETHGFLNLFEGFIHSYPIHFFALTMVFFMVMAILKIGGGIFILKRGPYLRF